jgi:hypothetical protein
MTPWEPDASFEPVGDERDAGVVRGIADFVTWFVVGHYASESPEFELEPPPPRRGRGRRDRSTTST